MSFKNKSLGEYGGRSHLTPSSPLLRHSDLFPNACRLQAEPAVKHKIFNKDQSFKVAEVSCFGARRMLTTPVMTSHLMKLSMRRQTSEYSLNNQRECATRTPLSLCHLWLATWHEPLREALCVLPQEMPSWNHP